MPPTPEQWTQLLKKVPLQKGSRLQQVVERHTRKPKPDTGLPATRSGGKNQRGETRTADGQILTPKSEEE